MRDHPWWLYLAATLITLAGISWLLSLLVGRHAKIFQAVGAFIFGFGFLFGLVGVIRAHEETRKPRISAVMKTESGLTLEGSAKVDGLRSRDHLKVLVESITWERDSRGRPRPSFEFSRRLYEAWLGPDASGSVEHAIHLPLNAPVGEELQDEIGIRAWVVREPDAKCRRDDREADEPLDCREDNPPPCFAREARGQTGCLRIRLPRSPSGPQLVATWGAGNANERILALRVGAEGVRPETGSVLVRVYGEGDQKDSAISSARLRPNVRGSVAAQSRIPVERRLPSVCVVAAIETDPGVRGGEPSCPPSEDVRTAWVRLARP